MAGMSGDHSSQADGGGRLGRTAPLKVKNTFIDVEDLTRDDDALDDSAMKDSFSKRQMSEPAPSLFQQSLLAPFSSEGYGNEFMPDFLRYPGWEDSLNDYSSALGGEELNVEDVHQLPRWPGDSAAEDMGGEGAMSAMAMNELLGSVGVPPPEWANTTTVMMRNIPNKYTQRMLLTEVNHTGFLGTFDFLYLPIDPETNANRGYAFMNFMDPGFAWMFKKSYEGRKMNRFNSNKVVSVAPATLQGFVANYAHYASSRVNRGDPAARPLFLRDPKDDMSMVSGTAQAGGGRRGGRRRGGGQAASSGMEQLMSRQAQQAQEEAVAAAQWGAAASAVGGCGMGTYFGLDGSSSGLEPPLPADAPAVGLKPKAKGDLVPKFCPHCGGAIQQGFQFCPHCGAGLDFPGAGSSRGL